MTLEIVKSNLATVVSRLVKNEFYFFFPTVLYFVTLLFSKLLGAHWPKFPGKSCGNS